MMETKVILILGGYGNTGRPLARLLLQESDAQLILAGRNQAKAESFAAELNHAFTGNRARGIYADASDEAQLRQAFAGVDLVVVASSTTRYTRQVASAALATRIGYLDIQYSTQKISLLKSMAERIRQAGCCFITDAGFHPGLPALLVRYVAQSFDRLKRARVGSVIKEDWKRLEVGESAIDELVDLINDYQMSVFKDGEWHKVSLFSTSDYIRMDFRGQFGKQYCAPMMLEEMSTLPELFPSLEETGFYVGSFNWFVDWIIMPISIVAMKLWPQAAKRPMSKWIHWGLNTFSKPPYGTLLKVEASGEENGRPKAVSVIISHPDGYLFTAIPVAACLLQYMDGSINLPGLWTQAHIVEPVRFIKDMQRMGIEVQRKDRGSNEVEQE